MYRCIYTCMFMYIYAAKRAVGGVEPEGVVQATACTYNAQCTAQGRGRRSPRVALAHTFSAADGSVRCVGAGQAVGAATAA